MTWVILAVIAALVTYSATVQSGKAQTRGAGQDRKGARMPAVSVSATDVRESDFKSFITALGSVVPLNTVTVKTRVDGQLMEVLFREGQQVKAGDLLARIDPRPFEVQLLQAEGQKIRDEQFLQNARVDLERYRVLWKQDSIPKQQLDTQDALVRQYEGAVKTDQGAIDNAKLQLTYSRITAPVSGRVGLRLVDPGNIVHAADATGLIVITQLTPISVIFPIPEDSLPAVLVRMKAGQRLQADAYDREMKNKIASGYLLTMDNQIDPTTGTVRLKAIFPNAQGELFPNQFVNVQLLMDIRKKAVVVPSPAIQRGVRGTYVYVVKPDSTVTVRPITVGEIQSGTALINTGLSPGERVVIDGTDRLREGAKVEVRMPGRESGQRKPR